MFIGVKMLFDYKKRIKIIYFLFIPIIIKIKTSDLSYRKIKILGITVFYKKQSNLETDEIQYYGIKQVSDKIIEIEMLMKAYAVNIREIKRLEQNLLKKFPNLF